MPGENIQDWSVTAANNANADSSIGWAEGQARASVNNSARSMMAAHAKDRNLHNGSITTGGTPNAQTFSSGVSYTSMPTGLRVTLKIGAALTNTAAATLEMDSLGAIAVKNQLGLDVSPGALFAGTYSELIYNGTTWVAMAASAGALENIRVFTASGTYPTTTSTCKVLAMCKGGGGSGGGSAMSGAYGGAGGEGAEAWKLTTAAALSAQTVTVGGGGGAQSPGVNATGATGSTSSIGVIVAAAGGGGGAAPNAGGYGGAGGATYTGDWCMPGAAGGPGSDASGGGLISLHGHGGGKGGASTATTAGVANSGGGGGGGTQGGASGVGGSGIVVCYEYGVI